MRQKMAEQETLETPTNNKIDKKQLGDDAMSGMLLDPNQKKSKSSNGKAAAKSQGSTDTCGCSIF
jgi:hypothetical protein